MATRRHNQTSSYRTYGSVAYAPAYDGSAVRAPAMSGFTSPSPRSAAKNRS